MLILMISLTANLLIVLGLGLAGLAGKHTPKREGKIPESVGKEKHLSRMIDFTRSVEGLRRRVY